MSSSTTIAVPRGRFDPRLYQIACLAGLLLWGVFFLDFDLTPGRAALLVASALATQWAGTRLTRLPAFDPKSALIACSLAVPLIDLVVPGPRFEWRARSARPADPSPTETPMLATHPPTAAAVLGLILLSLAATAGPAASFCGFYVAQADAKLFNKASQVALARDGDRTVMTMSNDYEGPLKEFAIVIPVPTVLEKDQVNVGERSLIEHLDAFSAPRLVEYHDPPPCGARELAQNTWGAMKSVIRGSRSMEGAADAPGVVIEAQYTVGEYDILILSASESRGLITWLTQNGYRVPAGAQRVLGAYIRQGLKFFVAKVNLGEQKKLGVSYLRPIQIAYESPRFMLPIRLGMVNANGAQELFVYALTPNGRVETVNYRTTKLSTDAEVPLFVKEEFGGFYRALFAREVRRTGMNAVILEYAWNASTCDPCAAAPLSAEELRQLGVSWLADGGRGRGVFVTRLHARYDAAHFPEDLVFQETANQEPFQGRYILRHPWKGEVDCPEGERYRTELGERRARQLASVVELTGWSREAVRQKMRRGDDAYVPALAVKQGPAKWWQNLWKR